MTAEAYKGITLTLTDELVGEPHEVPLLEVVGRAERAAYSGDAELAFELLYEAADLVEAMGLPAATMALLEDLGRIVPERLLTERNRAWLFNLEGLALVDLGRPLEAIDAFSRMAAIGDKITDADIAATAAQNLGAQAYLRGDLDEAERYYRFALTAKEAMRDRRAVAQLLLNLVGVSLDRGLLDDATKWMAEAERAVKRARDPSLRPSLHGNRGRLSVARGDFIAARGAFRLGLRRAMAVGDAVSVVRSAQNLGSIALDLDQPKEAETWYRRGLEVTEARELRGLEEGLRRGLALSLHRNQKDQEAADELGRVIELAEARGDDLSRARAKADLGALAISTGALVRADELLSDALSTFRLNDDEEWEIRTLGNLVASSVARGDAEAANRYADEALAVSSPPSRDRAELLRRAAKGWVIARRVDRAVEALRKSLDEFERAGEVGLAWETLQAAALLSEHGYQEDAVPFYDRALRLYELVGDSQMPFHVRNDRGNVLTALNRFADARKDYTACLELADRYEDRAMELRACSNFGELARREGSTEEAIALLQRAVDLAGELHEEADEANAWANLGLALRDAGRLDEAADIHTHALELAFRAEDVYAQSTALGGLAGVAFDHENYERAAEFYRKASELSLPPSGRVHIVEDLAGLTEALSALGREDETQNAAQRLVDLAQEIGETDIAAEGLSRAAVRWIDLGRSEEAVSLFAAAAQVSTANPTYNDEQASRALARAILQIVKKVEDAVEDEASHARILDATIEAASNADEDVARFLSDTVATASEVLKNLGKNDEDNAAYSV